MLKWFRKYNKIILVVGAVVLMVAFLIPQAVQMFSPQPGDFVVGEMAGQEVKERDLMLAARELELLEQLGIPPLMLPADRESYLMQQADARRLGLAVSSAEINSALETLGLGGEALEQAARRTGADANAVRAVVAKWLLGERYRMLVIGRRYDAAAGLTASPGVDSLMLWSTQAAPAVRQIQEADVPQIANQLMQRVLNEFSFLRAGTGRISPAATQHLAKNRLERVAGRLVVIRPPIDDNTPIDEVQLERLFEEYKSFQPGRGAPYPFGYLLPPRVDLEVLSFPMEKALALATVEPLDVLAYYRDNRDQFADAATGEQAPETPTAGARAAIEAQLRAEQGEALIDRALSEARAALDADVRGFPTSGGYRELPDAFTPKSMSLVADQVEDATGFRPDVLVTDGLTPLDKLFGEMPGFAMSQLENARLGGAQMLMLAKSLQEDSATVPIRLQAGVMAPATLGADGGKYLPRLVTAEPSEEPDSLDVVRDRVTADARRVLAYERLAEQTDALRAMAAADGMDTLAAQYGTVAEPVSPLPRRDEGARNPDGSTAAPELPGVGRSDALIDAAFAAVAGRGVVGELTEAIPAGDRIVVEPVDRALAVAVFEPTRYEAATRSRYEQMLDETAGIASDFSLLGGVPIDSPLIPERLAERLGYDLDNDDDLPIEDETKAPAEAEAAAG